ncbi:phage BR0599 family protein [Actibacterium sp. MT2.3-13A]|uniref:phage BR0599 family protein n=1 Tax=Actibacterium sp. MT2.3-13A TaxID=2828332 RepID=UPI001BA91968|nr:phage BR0599 family protein [Actibacterium sp. MT2.3-13A]
MSYTAIAALISGKRPLWLYDLTLGATTTRYAARSANYTYASNSYTASSIAHTRIRQTSAIGRAETTIVLPRTDAFAIAVRDNIGTLETAITIRHGFVNDADQEFVVKFRGRVIDVRAMLGTITLVCENRFTEMRRKGLAAVMQRPCRHALYHTGCGLNIADFETAGTATAWASPVLTVTEAGAQADGYYSGGVVTYAGARQMIVSHTGTALKLLGPVPDLAAAIAASGSASVSIAPGCDLSTTTCNGRFSNIDNFGGFPWMTDSPFDGRAIG